jgi:hypothetical protein
MTVWAYSSTVKEWLGISDDEFTLVVQGNGVGPNGAHITVEENAPGRYPGDPDTKVTITGYAHDLRDEWADMRSLVNKYMTRIHCLPTIGPKDLYLQLYGSHDRPVRDGRHGHYQYWSQYCQECHQEWRCKPLS